MNTYIIDNQVNLSIFLLGSFLSVSLSIYIYSICISFYLYVYLLYFNLSICISMYIFLSVFLSICISLYLGIQYIGQVDENSPAEAAGNTSTLLSIYLTIFCHQTLCSVQYIVTKVCTVQSVKDFLFGFNV